MKKSVFAVFMLVIIVALGFIMIRYYEYIFARTVTGKIERVERVIEPVAIIDSQATDPQNVFSFAVAIREDKTNEIVTGSTEDRQWAVVETGKCGVVKFFPYPPWNLEKSGTYHKVRLISLYDCL